MARSQTILEGDWIPLWARYAVVVCHSHTRSDAPKRDTVQVFSSRAACERFARELACYFPRPTGEDLTLWALVYALGKARNRRGYTFASGNICYAAFDPGGIALKWHDIPSGYGVPGERPIDDSCACCPPGGWSTV